LYGLVSRAALAHDSGDEHIGRASTRQRSNSGRHRIALHDHGDGRHHAHRHFHDNK